ERVLDVVDPAGRRQEPGRVRRAGPAARAARGARLRDFELGPLLWTREQWFLDEPGHCGQRENVYLVRVAPFEPVPDEDPTVEDIRELDWFTAAEAAELPTRPEDLALRLRSASGW